MLLIATLLLSFAFAQGNQTQERTQLQDPSIGTQETVQTRTNTQQRIQI
ncbi:hypothetical protein KKH82_02395 [Patescibacteria group bacterium]|nr:hypothetical protein [Patescibacteria group bacterium]